MADAELRIPLLAEAIALHAMNPVSATGMAAVKESGGRVEGLAEVVDGVYRLEDVGDGGVSQGLDV